MNVVAFCSMNKAEKSTKESNFFLIVWFRNVKRRRRQSSIRLLSFDVIRTFFAEKICSFWASFSALRLEIAILFDEMIDRKSRTIATKTIFFSITFSTRKIFWVVFSTETLKRKVSRSEIIEKMITKNEKRHRNDE